MTDKHKKDLRRRKKKEDEARKKSELAERVAYPKVIFTGRADAAFERLIQEAVKRTPFNSDVFPHWEQEAYQRARRIGFAPMFQSLQNEGMAVEETPKHIWITVNFGHQVFLQAGEELRQYLLMNDVFFRYGNKEVIAEFRQLLRSKSTTGHGAIRHSPFRPPVVIDGRRYIFGFAEHAMDQIGLRLSPHCYRYAAHGDIFHYFYDCKHVVGGKMLDQIGNMGPCVSIFQKISGNADKTVFPLLHSVLSDLIEDDGSGVFARMGYCPVAIDGDFAKAKTLVPPGFGKTPEASLYDSPLLSRQMKKDLREIGTSDDSGYGIFHANPNLLRFFHNNGFPQVVLGSDPCFAYLQSRSNQRSLVIRE